MNIWLSNNVICEYCKQVAPTCNKQMNFTTLCMDIQLILYWVITYLQHQIRQEIIGVQIAALKLKQPNLVKSTQDFLQCIFPVLTINTGKNC